MAKAPATKQQPKPPAVIEDDLSDLLMEHSGEGISQLADDRIVPLIRILQTNSPAVNKRDPAYVEGAEAGFIWLRNTGIDPIDGEEGIVVQPCFFSKQWLEWAERSSGQGLVAVHAERPAGAIERPLPNKPKRKGWFSADGNLLVETRQHVVIVYFGDGSNMPFVLPLSSSGATVSRAWMALMSSRKHNGKEMASFGNLYRIKTTTKTNADGTWFLPVITFEKPVTTRDDLMRGIDLFKAFASGEKVAEADSKEEEHAADDEM